MTDWPVKTLGDVCVLVNGATPDTKVKDYWGGKHAWITLAEMGGLDSPFLSISRRTLSDKGLASCSATLVPPKTVILSSRAPIGHLVINEVPMATNQGCKSLIPKDGLDFSFLYYYLKANVELLESLGTGTTFKELSGTQLKTVEIPMPPLEEQKRIVALLDAATARVTELTACYEQARTQANNLFTSASREAFESNPNWPVKTLGDVCVLVNGATPDTKVKDYWGGKHAWITPAEMGGLDSPFLSISRRTLSDKGLASCSATLVPPKTVILSSRAPIGHLVINEVPMATNQGCKSLIPKDGLDFSFLYYYLKANVELLESLGTGTTFKELSGTQLKTVEIPMPPLEEQERIVGRLDSMRAKTSEMVAAYDAKLTAAKNLRQSILESAFAGDL